MTRIEVGVLVFFDGIRRFFEERASRGYVLFVVIASLVLHKLVA